MEGSCVRNLECDIQKSRVVGFGNGMRCFGGVTESELLCQACVFLLDCGLNFEFLVWMFER